MVEPVKRVKTEINHQYTPSEREELATRLAKQHIEIEMAEEQKRNATAGAASLIKEMKEKVRTMSRNLNRGFCERMVDANLVIDRDVMKRRYYYDPASNALIKETPLEWGDEQAELDLGDYDEDGAEDADETGEDE